MTASHSPISDPTETASTAGDTAARTSARRTPPVKRWRRWLAIGVATAHCAPGHASIPSFIQSAGDAKSFVEDRALTIIDGLQLIALLVATYFGIWAGIKISQGDQNGKSMLISALIGGIIATGITQILKFVLTA